METGWAVDPPCSAPARFDSLHPHQDYFAPPNSSLERTSARQSASLFCESCAAGRSRSVLNVRPPNEPQVCHLVSLLDHGFGVPSGRVESGSVRIICGQQGHPCNFHIVAPKDLIRASVSIDGSEVVPLFPVHIEHPYHTLVRGFFGIEPNSETAVATFFVPPGVHVLVISQPGWQPIKRTVVGPGSGEHGELIIPQNELRKTAP